MERLFCVVRDAATTGFFASPGPGAVFSTFANATPSGQQQPLLDGLTVGQVVRAFFHAAAVGKQAQPVLVDIQSAAASCTAAVPILLHALDTKQRHQLQQTLVDLDQQQHALQRSPQQPHPQHKVQPWVQLLGQLCVWDVLLLLGMWGDPQWEMDACMVLLRSLRDITSLQELTQLFANLGSVSPDAAVWLLDVGVTWAVTCYLDLPVDDDITFEQGGSMLLKAGIWSTVDLAKQAMSKVLQKLTAEGSLNTALWDVLQYVVSRCNHTLRQQQLGQEQCEVMQAAGIANCSSSCSKEASDINVTALCVQQLLAVLPGVLQHQDAEFAMQYVSTIHPLAAQSCDASHAMLAACKSLLHLQPGSDEHVERMHAGQKQQLTIKREVQEYSQLEGGLMQAAAVAATLTEGPSTGALASASAQLSHLATPVPSPSPAVAPPLHGLWTPSHTPVVPTALQQGRIQQQQGSDHSIMQASYSGAAQARLEHLLHEANAMLHGSSTPAASSATNNAHVKQLVDALLCGVLQHQTPCCSSACQQDLADGVQQILSTLDASGLQQLAQRYKQHVQRIRPQQQSLSTQSQPEPTSIDLSTRQASQAGVSGGSKFIDGQFSAAAVHPSSAGSAHYSLQGLWQQALLQLLLQLLDQLVKPAADAAAASLNDNASCSCVHLPIVMGVLLESLGTFDEKPSSTAAAAMEGYAIQPGQQQQQQQPAVGTEVSEAMEQLLAYQEAGKLFAAEQPNIAGSSLQACAAQLRLLLLRYHTLSWLLVWLLQNRHASSRVMTGRAAGHTADANAVTAQGTTAAAAEAFPAAADAAVEVEDTYADVVASQLQEPYTDTPAAASQRCGYQFKATQQLVSIALELQCLQSVLLPAAVEKLLAAMNTAAVAGDDASAGSGHQTQQTSGQCMQTPNTVAAVRNSGPATTSNKRSSCSFFIIHTPAEKQAAAAHAAQLADSLPTASTAEAGCRQQQEGTAGAAGNLQQTRLAVLQLLPKPLLQLPQVPLQVCQQLLIVVSTELDSLIQQMQHTEQLQGAGGICKTQQVYGRRTPRLRRSSSVAQQLQQQHRSTSDMSASQVEDPAVSWGTSQSGQAKSACATDGDSAGVVSDEQYSAAATRAAAHSHPAVHNSKQASRMRSATLTSSLQQLLSCADFVVNASAAWTHQCAAGGQGSQPIACGFADNSQAAEAAHGTAVLLLRLHNLLNTVKLSAVDVTACSPSLGSVPVQQRRRSACTALSTAAELLEVWWTTSCKAGHHNRGTRIAGSSSHNPESMHSTRQQQLAEYLRRLEYGIAHAEVVSRSNSDGPLSAGNTVTLSWSDVALVFGHGVGSISWSAIKRLQQQEQLLAVLLALLIKIHKLTQDCNVDEPKEGEGGRSLGDAVVFDGLLQQLAVLSAIAADVYSTSAGAAAGVASSVGGPAWLLRLMMNSYQKLVTGPMLPASVILTPAAVSALFRLCQARCLPLHQGHQLSSQTAGASACRAPSSTISVAAHLLCLHHSPKVYAAAETCIWGKQGMALELHDEGPTWMKGCTRDVAAAAARTSLLLLTEDMSHDWTGALTVTDGSVTATDDDSTLLPPNQQSVLFWQSCAAAVAAVCDCCELLLYHSALQEKHCRQQQQLSSGYTAARSGNQASSSTATVLIGTWCERQQCDDLRLVTRSLAAVLSGPCSAAAKHLVALMTSCGQQQGGAQVPASGSQLDDEAALQSSDTPAATTEGDTDSTQGKKKLPGKAARKRSSTAACLVSRLQLQLSMLLGLGCAVGKMVLAKRSKLLRLLDQQCQPATSWAARADIKQDVRQLLHALRGFNDAHQALTQAMSDAAEMTTAEDSTGDVSLEDQVQEISALLESAAERCAGSSRKDAWAAVAAAAALILDDSSGSDSENEKANADREQQGVMKQCQSMDTSAKGTTSSGPAAADVTDASARFCDPEVHEELPCGELSSSDSEEGDDDDSDKKMESDDDNVEQADVLQQDVAASAACTAQQVQQRAKAQLQAVFKMPPARARDREQQRQQQQELVSEKVYKTPQTPFASTPASKAAGTAALAISAARAAAAAAGRQSASQQQQPLSPQVASAVCEQTPAVAVEGPCGGLSSHPARNPAAAMPSPSLQQQPARTTVEAARSQLALAFGKTSLPARAAARVLSPIATGRNVQQQGQVPVICGDKEGSFNMASGQVTLPDGKSLTPSAFERLGGKGTCKKWRKSLRVTIDDGQHDIALGRWLLENTAAPAVEDTAAEDKQGEVEPLQSGSRKRRLSQASSPDKAMAAGGAAEVAEADDGAGAAGAAAATSGKPAKKARLSQPREQDASNHADAATDVEQQPAGAAKQQRILQQQQQQTGKSPRRLLVVPVQVDKTSRQEDSDTSSKEQPRFRSRRRQQQKAQPAADRTGQPRNAFVQACLAEDRLRRSTAVTSDEESEDDSDYSDLEDFIVVQRDIDYSRLCAEAGGRVSWKPRWQQRPGAAVRRGLIGS